MLSGELREKGEESQQPTKRFSKFRKCFVAARDRASESQKTEEGDESSEWRFVGRHLAECVFGCLIGTASTRSCRRVEMWTTCGPRQSIRDYAQVTANGDRTDTYDRCLRVRLQQLVNNFFKLRRFHGERSMKQLWEVARYSKSEAFCVVEGRGNWSMDYE